MFSKAIVIGRLGREIEMRYGSSGTAVGSGVVAVTEKRKDQESTMWLDFVTFGKTAENITKYFKKGDAIGLDGKLRQEEWDDKQSGQKRKKISMVANSFFFLGKGEQRQQQGGDRPVDPEIGF